MSLPSGYTKLEYIESSGTQYIDTGFKPNQNTSVHATVSGWNTSSKSSSIFGSRASSSSAAYMVMINASGVFRSDYGTSQATFSSASAAEKTVIQKDKNVCSIGAATVTNATSTFSCTYNMFLCGTNTGGSLSHGFVGKLYSCQIYDNGTLIRDYIPCKNASSVVGLWDDVNSAFYKNDGTGTFTAGPAYDPMAPKGDHNTNIGNVAFSISGGTVLIGGIAQEIGGGMALIGGVVREINIGGAERATFFIKDYTRTSTYEFEVGMTWEDFVSSDYNDGRFSVSSGRVWFVDTGYDVSLVVVTSDYDGVDPTDTITAGVTYRAID